MKSVTLVKKSPDQKVGVGLREKGGAIYIKKISKSGLFANSELGVDDKVLSINGKRFAENQTLEEYKEMTLDDENIEKITIVVRKAGARASTSKSRKKKKFKKEVHLNPDGTPVLGSAFGFGVAQEEAERVQVMCKATKATDGQDVGLAFVKVGDKLFVSGISGDSIFHPDRLDDDGAGGDGQLEFGDRVASVNDTNFMSYADVDYALALLRKQSTRECVLYVEKGWNVLRSGHVDPIHFDPSLAKRGKVRHKPTAAARTAAGADRGDDDGDSASSEEVPNNEPPDSKGAAPSTKDDGEGEEGEKMWWDT